MNLFGNTEIKGVRSLFGLASFLTSFRPEVREYEKQIDQLVYKLYGLMTKGTKTVEASVKL